MFQERDTACCLREDQAGCVQTQKSECKGTEVGHYDNLDDGGGGDGDDDDNGDDDGDGGDHLDNRIKKLGTCPQRKSSDVNLCKFCPGGIAIHEMWF